MRVGQADGGKGNCLRFQKRMKGPWWGFDRDVLLRQEGDDVGNVTMTQRDWHLGLGVWVHTPL